MAKGRVVVDPDRCKGCELCALACPQGVLVLSERLNARGYHPIQYVDPEHHCTGCALCAVMCPDVCLTVYRESAAAREPLSATRSRAVTV